MELLGFELSLRRKAAQPLRPLSSGRDGWWPIVREPYTGAWQANVELRSDTLLSNPTVFACVTRISQDISKLRLRLVERVDEDIWIPVTNAAYSPVLRRPNHYQTTTQFVAGWISSKLVWGNTIVLKERDARGVVSAMHILNPPQVTTLVAADGAVFYELHRPVTDLTGLWSGDGSAAITVPARDVIHDRINCVFDPLVGLSPLYAAGMPALLGSTILKTSTTFFAKGAQPSGTLTTDREVTTDLANAMQKRWLDGFGGPDNAGKVAVLGYNLKYEPLTQTAVDAQLQEQAGLTEIEVCKCFGVPVALLNTTVGAPYGNHAELVQLYHDTCLQALIVGTETSLDEGLGIEQPVNGTQYGTEFDIDDLYWMDVTTRVKAATDAVSGGVLSPNEARRKYFSLGPVKGGDSPLAQQQYYSLAALAERDAMQPFAKPAPPAPEPDDVEPEAEP